MTINYDAQREPSKLTRAITLVVLAGMMCAAAWAAQRSRCDAFPAEFELGGILGGSACAMSDQALLLPYAGIFAAVVVCAIWSLIWSRRPPKAGGGL